eukprot:TRINITY_DN6729_c0_g1_i1.p1 TRINITY_DN6729_c0_g1~~TRINITY_DN6729_c0_g1_i1.p1  ORF type:complete len:121 (-),score=19.87 TRINITY_DN6729_c0_g1_i1:8-370(-)
MNDIAYLLPGPHTGATLQFNPYMNLWFMVLLDSSTGDPNIYMATAPQITGPWSTTPIYTFEPPYSNVSLFWAYQAKSHPEYATQPNQIYFSYTLGSQTPNEEVTDMSTYHPQFMVVTISP